MLDEGAVEEVVSAIHYHAEEPNVMQNACGYLGSTGESYFILCFVAHGLVSVPDCLCLCHLYVCACVRVCACASGMLAFKRPDVQPHQQSDVVELVRTALLPTLISWA